MSVTEDFSFAEDELDEDDDKQQQLDPKFSGLRPEEESVGEPREFDPRTGSFTAVEPASTDTEEKAPPTD